MHLKVEIKSYWHPGTGRGQGSHLDATTHRNAKGVPSLPGRTIKGLIRDAVYRWEQFGGYGDPVTIDMPTITERLFGPYGQRDKTLPATSGKTWPGLLRFADAELPSTEVACLVNDVKLRDGLYRTHFSTAINHATGTATAESLRGIELVIPLTLWATVELVPNAKYQDLNTTWPVLLTQALPLIQAVGAHRSRGLGRATLTLVDNKAP